MRSFSLSQQGHSAFIVSYSLSVGPPRLNNEFQENWQVSSLHWMTLGGRASADANCTLNEGVHPGVWGENVTPPLQLTAKWKKKEPTWEAPCSSVLLRDALSGLETSQAAKGSRIRIRPSLLVIFLSFVSFQETVGSILMDGASDDKPFSKPPLQSRPITANKVGPLKRNKTPTPPETCPPTCPPTEATWNDCSLSKTAASVWF